MNTRLLASLLLVPILAGCAQTETKRAAFPELYATDKPVTMVIVPAINESTAAEAGDFLNVTVAQPFANHGYYVIPVPIVADIFRSEGILEGSQLTGMPVSVFRENFGADSVLFLTIVGWDTIYAVVAANVSVAIEYVLISTATGEAIWSYEEKVVVDTGSSSGSLLIDVIATAISTTVTDYVPIARSVHEAAIKSMPYGGYHPKNGLDGEEKAVRTKAKDGALKEFDSGLVAGTVLAPSGSDVTDDEMASGQDLIEAEKSHESIERVAESRAAVELVGESMMCSEAYTLESKRGDRETWSLDCSDGEFLEVLCVGDDCYIR